MLVAGGTAPPIPNAAVCIPQPAKYDLAVVKLSPSVQAVPLYSSLSFFALGTSPPKTSAEALPVPAAAPEERAVFKAPPVAQAPAALIIVLKSEDVVLYQISPHLQRPNRLLHLKSFFLLLLCNQS